MRILLVEDEDELAATLKASLERRAFTVDRVRRLGEARDALALGGFDLVLLDRRLPDGEGLATLQALSKNQRRPAVIVLSARDALEDRIEGLEAGADDYLPKPFAVEELVARIAAVTRRGETRAPETLTFGDVTLDTQSLEARVGEMSAPLPRREAQILAALLRARGRGVTREGLIEAVYGLDAGEVEDTAIEGHLSRLRARLRDAGAKLTIRAIRGVGYQAIAE